MNEFGDSRCVCPDGEMSNPTVCLMLMVWPAGVWASRVGCWEDSRVPVIKALSTELFLYVVL